MFTKIIIAACLLLGQSTSSFAQSSTLTADQIQGISTVKNYLQRAGHFEKNAAGINSYADAAGTSPVDGTAGSPSLTCARSTSSPLAGTGSLIITKDAVNRQGNGCSADFSVDSKDKARVMSIEFDYAVVSGTFVAGSTGSAPTASDITFWIYDVTNTTLIQPSSISLFSNSTTIADRYSATFQTASNSTSYRLIAHVGTVSALAYVIKLDDIVVRPSSYVFGAPVSDWAAVTVTGSWTANTTYTAFEKRVGDTGFYRVKALVSGAPTSANLTINLPAGRTIDTAKLQSTTGNGNAVGFGQVHDAGTQNYPVIVNYNSSTSIIVATHNAAGTSTHTGSPVTQILPMTFNNADEVNVEFSVPLVGLSSSVQMSDSANTRVIATRATLSANQTGVNTNGTFVKVNIDSTSLYGGFDRTGAWASSRFTATTAGDYQVNAKVLLAGANVLADIYFAAIYKNGALFSTGPYSSVPSAGQLLSRDANDIVPLVAGDFIEIFIFGNGNNSVSTLTVTGGQQFGTYVAINRISGPSAIAATESVNARYTTAAGQSIASAATAIIDFGTRDFDSHNAVTTGASWRFTAPISGKYKVTTNVRYANGLAWGAGQFVSSLLFKNGSSFSTNDFLFAAAITPGQGPSSQLTDTVSLLAGEYIDIRTSHGEASARALVAAGTLVRVAIKRVGN